MLLKPIYKANLFVRQKGFILRDQGVFYVCAVEGELSAERGPSEKKD